MVSLFLSAVEHAHLPLQPVIMVMGGIALWGVVFPPLGQILGLLTWFVVAFNDQSCWYSRCSRYHFSSIKPGVFGSALPSIWDAYPGISPSAKPRGTEEQPIPI
jgi:hypothetical protein